MREGWGVLPQHNMERHRGISTVVILSFSATVAPSFPNHFKYMHEDIKRMCIKKSSCITHTKSVPYIVWVVIAMFLEVIYRGPMKDRKSENCHGSYVK